MSISRIDRDTFFEKEVIGNVRSTQEDSHGYATMTPNGDVFVVCDGMGGHVGGKTASTIAVGSIIEYLAKEQYPEPFIALDGALQYANLQIIGHADAHPELRGMGTTACIVLLQGEDAYIAHVGDSRIYLFLGKEQQLHRITKDHSFVQSLVDAGQITDDEAEHHPNKNRILKALGIKTDLKPTFNKVQPKNGDVFLICSDGLSGMLPDKTISGVLSANKRIGEKGETLVNLALEAGGLDNITLELVQISNSGHLKSNFQSFNPKSSEDSFGMNYGNKKKVRGTKAKTRIAAGVIALAVLLLSGVGIWYALHKKYLTDHVNQLKIELNQINQDLDEKDQVLQNIQEKIEQAKTAGASTVLYEDSFASCKVVIDSLKNKKREIKESITTLQNKSTSRKH